jgi:hypothetical protein
MTILLASILHDAINPALALLPAKMTSDRALIMLLAIGLQESRFMYRAQKTGNPYVKGPAKGYWQFERGGGVSGVVHHYKAKDDAEALCKARNVLFDSSLIHAALEFDDVLAAGFARLLLWTSPDPLPALNAEPEEAWQYYKALWRPGKPHRETWDQFHTDAVAQVMEVSA